MNALQFLRPEWLWLLLSLLPLAWWLRRRAAHATPWRDEVDPHLLDRLIEPSRDARAGAGAWLALPALALAIVALAGPSWTRAEQPLWQTRAPLVVALDLSGAIRAEDLPYRPCVGIMLINRQGRVWIGRRPATPDEEGARAPGGPLS